MQQQLLAVVLNTDRQQEGEAGIHLRLCAVQNEDKGSEEMYKEVVDGMRRSGAGVNSDESLNEDVPGFRQLAEIHSVS